MLSYSKQPLQEPSYEPVLQDMEEESDDPRKLLKSMQETLELDTMEIMQIQVMVKAQATKRTQILAELEQKAQNLEFPALAPILDNNQLAQQSKEIMARKDMLSAQIAAVKLRAASLDFPEFQQDPSRDLLCLSLFQELKCEAQGHGWIAKHQDALVKFEVDPKMSGFYWAGWVWDLVLD